MFVCLPTPCLSAKWSPSCTRLRQANERRRARAVDLLLCLLVCVPQSYCLCVCYRALHIFSKIPCSYWNLRWSVIIKLGNVSIRFLVRTPCHTQLPLQLMLLVSCLLRHVKTLLLLLFCCRTRMARAHLTASSTLMVPQGTRSIIISSPPQQDHQVLPAAVTLKHGRTIHQWINVEPSFLVDE